MVDVGISDKTNPKFNLGNLNVDMNLCPKVQICQP